MNEFYNKLAEGFADAVSKHPKVAFGVAAACVVTAGYATGCKLGEKVAKYRNKKKEKVVVTTA